MKKTLVFLLFVLMSISLFAERPTPDLVKQDMKRVADWQIEHFRDNFSNLRRPHHPLDWTNAALYVGMVKWADMADDDSYWEWLKGIGEQYNYQLYKRRYDADDQAVGQMYVGLYRKYGDKKMIAPTIKEFNYVYYHPAQTRLNWAGNKAMRRDRWSWCDALFMAPPVWAQLYSITGEQKYLDFLMREYKATTDFLFDDDEHLYFRDESYKEKRENEKKVFWARGNGWVFGGLVAVMNELDPKSKEYKYFLKIYKKMAAKLIAIQTEKGHWAMSLLADDIYPTPETSGTAFYTFGLAWGINQGILDRESYEPATMKAWKAMISYVSEEGKLGYVQPVGVAPGQAWLDKTEVYGTGAFLSAGSEIYKLVGGK